MKSVTIFLSLLSSALAVVAAPALEIHQVHDHSVDPVDPIVSTTTIPLRLLDRDGNHTQTLEPRASGGGENHFTFPSNAGCVVRVWFDDEPESEGAEQQRLGGGDSDSASTLYPEPSDIVFDPDEDEDGEYEPCVTLGVDSGDGKGEQGLMVRKIDVNCPY
ncbi:hypothetical protein PG994_005409 [Apiospora phragmitis]|uniref:Uncharacterized protein n=1 Tax=Apiospora phragmitis TaxID=2905665 RepID=A0ABR1VFW6_9PEZI